MSDLNPKPESRAAEKLPEPSMELSERLHLIGLVIVDVDGTLTDGGVVLGQSEEMKVFHIRDGFGLKMLMRAGIDVAIVTGRESAAVERRAAELGVPNVLQGEENKGAAVERLAAELGVGRKEILAIGDDVPDLPIFRRVGVSVAVADAAPEVIEAADWVTSLPGGHGAVRETAELILRARNLWDDLVEDVAKS